MTDTLTPVLSAHWDDPQCFTLDSYRRAGGYQALAALCEGWLVADVISAVASIDPMMGGVDR